MYIIKGNETGERKKKKKAASKRHRDKCEIVVNYLQIRFVWLPRGDRRRRLSGSECISPRCLRQGHSKIGITSNYTRRTATTRKRSILSCASSPPPPQGPLPMVCAALCVAQPRRNAVRVL